MTPEEEYEVHTNAECAEGLLAVPDYMRGGMVRYILHGIMPGDFLQHVLSGDLFGALRKADDTNFYILQDYGLFLFNYAPAECFGSGKQVVEWSLRGGLLRTGRGGNDT